MTSPAPDLQPGQMFTVVLHRMGMFRCGRWHGVVTGFGRTETGVWLKEAVPAGGRWEYKMNAFVEFDKLVPLEVQVDLFGNPAPALTAGGVR